MVDKRYLNWKNKLGYGTGDIAGNVIYAFLSTFMMFYLTDTVGMNVGVVGTLIALSKLFDGITDLFFGHVIDRTHTKMGKARPWMLFGYVGCAALLAAIFMIPESWGDIAKYAYFFIMGHGNINREITGSDLGSGVGNPLEWLLINHPNLSAGIECQPSGYSDPIG